MKSTKMSSLQLFASAALVVAGLSLSTVAHAATGNITNFKVTTRQAGSGTPGQPGSYYTTIYRIDYTYDAQWTTAGGRVSMSVYRQVGEFSSEYVGGEDQTGILANGVYTVGPKSGYTETNKGTIFKGSLSYFNEQTGPTSAGLDTYPKPT